MFRKERSMRRSSASSPIRVQPFLKGARYPMSKKYIRETIVKENAPREVVNMIEKLPDKEYNSPIDITKEIGKLE